MKIPKRRQNIEKEHEKEEGEGSITKKSNMKQTKIMNRNARHRQKVKRKIDKNRKRKSSIKLGFLDPMLGKCAKM